jgi:hypothetical protein
MQKGQSSKDYLGANGATYRLGRAIKLRRLPQKEYDDTRDKLKHKGPYLPVIMEACQENQLAYEYRNGAQSYGAFTFNLAASLRASRAENKNLTFAQLMDDICVRLEKLKYNQAPNLVGAKKILKMPIPWNRQESKAKRKTRSRTKA